VEDRSHSGLRVGLKAGGLLVDGSYVTALIRPAIALERSSIAALVDAGVRVSTALAVCMLPVCGAIQKPSWTKQSLVLIDIPMVLVGIFGVIRLILRGKTSSLVTKFGLVYLAGQLISLASTPTSNGVLQLTRLFASLIIIEELGSLPVATRAKFERLLIALSVAETALVIAHQFVGHALASNFIEAYSSPFSDDGKMHPEGSFQHWYILAAFALMIGAVAVSGAMRGTLSAPWVLAGVAPAGFFALAAVGRNAAAGAIILAVCLLLALVRLPARRLLFAGALLVLVLSSVLGVLSQRNAWSGRASSIKTVSAIADRNQKIQQAIELWKTDRITGVGLGNYMAALDKSPARSLDPQFLPVHNYALFVLAESGVIGVLAGLPLLGVLLSRLRKRPILAVAPLLAIAPFLALDMLFADIPTGILMLAVGIGFFAFRADNGELATEKKLLPDEIRS
jgi:O-antigen ligase